MTIIPNFRVTGVLAIVVSLIVPVWAAAFVDMKPISSKLLMGRQML